jgi:hypothetical protein
MNRGITILKHCPAGPGSGVVAHIASTGIVVFNAKLDDGRWVRLPVPEKDVIYGATEKETRKEMERRFGGPQTT